MQVFPHFAEIFASWQPLQEPGRGVGDLLAWRDLLEDPAQRDAIFQVLALLPLSCTALQKSLLHELHCALASLMLRYRFAITSLSFRYCFAIASLRLGAWQISCMPALSPLVVTLSTTCPHAWEVSCVPFIPYSATRSVVHCMCAGSLRLCTARGHSVPTRRLRVVCRVSGARPRDCCLFCVRVAGLHMCCALCMPGFVVGLTAEACRSLCPAACSLLTSMPPHCYCLLQSARGTISCTRREWQSFALGENDNLKPICFSVTKPNSTDLFQIGSNRKETVKAPHSHNVCTHVRGTGSKVCPIFQSYQLW